MTRTKYVNIMNSLHFLAAFKFPFISIMLMLNEIWTIILIANFYDTYKTIYERFLIFYPFRSQCQSLISASTMEDLKLICDCLGDLHHFCKEKI